MFESYNKILVTGGVGFIASHLVEMLLSFKKEVVVFDNLSTGLKQDILKGVEFVKGDIRNPNEIRKVAKGVDLIFHVAANATVSVNNPRSILK